MVKFMQENLYVAAHNKEEALYKAKSIYKDACDVKQDDDVLDTWFSSALFPIASLGWPSNRDNIKEFYPLSIMETGHDILFFWVVRMFMLCSHLTGQNPFDKVLLHGILCDSTGKKMSKSSGNVIDPIDIINGTSQKELSDRLFKSHNDGALDKMQFCLLLEDLKTVLPNGIPACSADSLRLALAKFDIKSQNINFDIKQVISYNHFCNKIWQSVKFFLKAIESSNFEPTVLDDNLEINSNKLTRIDLWILNQLSKMVSKCNAGFYSYDFHLVVEAIQEFWTKKYCDVYLEIVKIRPDEINLTSNIMATCILTLLKAICPFTPHLSEEIYQRVFKNYFSKSSITIMSYPDAQEWEQWNNIEIDKTINLAVLISHGIRSLKQINKSGKDTKALIQCSNNFKQDLEDLKYIIKRLSHVESIEVTIEPPENISKYALKDVTDNLSVYIEVNGNLSLLSPSKKTKFEAELKKLKKKVVTSGYKNKTSVETKNRNKGRIVFLETELAKLNENE